MRVVGKVSGSNRSIMTFFLAASSDSLPAPLATPFAAPLFCAVSTGNALNVNKFELVNGISAMIRFSKG